MRIDEYTYMYNYISIPIKVKINFVRISIFL